MSGPPRYPLLGSKTTYDTKLSDPGAKLCDSLAEPCPFSLSSVPLETQSSRKRYRANPNSETKEDAYPAYAAQVPCSAESGDDMIISDTDTVPDATHPPKRRLTSVHSADARQVPASADSVMSISSANSVSAQMNTLSTSQSIRSSSNAFIKPTDSHVHPCTPNAIESMTNSPISDMEDQNPQQLVLPSPSASPVQSANEKRSVHEFWERYMMKPPATQGDLAELMVNLSNFSSAPCRNHIIFQLLQQVDRSSLSTFCGVIQDSLRRDLLSSLPLEIALSILSHLDYKSVLAVSQVCRTWHRLVNSNTLWTSMLYRDKLLTDSTLLDKELSHSGALIAGWSTPSPYLTEINLAQTLYKKRFIILQRWMNPSYEPKRISVAGHGPNIVTCLQHDEDKVITGIEGKSINVYATRTGELLRVLKGHDGGVWALKYFSNTLVSGSTDRDVRVWNIRTGRCTHMFRGHTSTVRCLDILHPVQIGVNDNGEPIMYPKEPLLVTGSRDHNLHVWKLPLDNEEENADEITETKTYDSKDPDNPYLVAVLVGHTQSVRSVSGYGNIIISGSYDTTVRVWDLKEGGRCKHVLEGHNDRIYSTSLNYKTRRCYSGSMDSSINVWDFEKGKLLFSLEGHNSLVGLLELSEDYLVSAAADSTLRVWNPHTGENYSKLKGHNSAITCFQHDSLRIVSGSERMLKLWDVKTGKFVRDLLSDITKGIWQVRFDPDRCVAAVQKQGSVNEETYIEILDFSAPLNKIEA
ncbi:hypothetical protein FT663_03041 [Candidozyma haemuli var. vulneris]|uniref:F-box domain-containing protein n=1 Tax=Candidozyma haemuli TaxID=45357 RepID=A0A2V1AQB7_9ASCO|nr:hypothetical protein CXQ85_001762 [[Candida] haemuloni]KAF3986657.1 hypothetical protein FT662_04438 [[Candida] haemuloni var. vulneris]KAF3990775.1 hypothetical protein FT663_03041 [[Candida] haemuloni var. vulneris]PVH19985.1 hypothetical protein CXQ85_001762 [[Candida] haemuloni]